MATVKSRFGRGLLGTALCGLLFVGFAVRTTTAQSPIVNRHLYSETADPAADIAAAQKIAQRQHKHILLEFGGNWCGDCVVLDYYEHQPPNSDLLESNYVVVHVDIGHMDHNVDVAEKYHVPITKGVPAIAVLDAHGNLLYAEQPKEFEHSSPEAVAALLNRWKPGPKG